MQTRVRIFNKWTLFILMSFFSLTLFTPSVFSAGSIIDEWNSIKRPPAPQLNPVTVNPATTALLLLDFNKQTCNPERRPRCIASIPAVEKLTKQARAKGVSVIYSLSAGATVSDIAKPLAPVAGEPSVTSGPDKFMGTDLEKILRDKGIKTVIVTGTAAHGAVIYTASGAALRGLKVIVPVEGMSAENPYAEQYTAWHLLNAPRVSAQVTLTGIKLIKF